MAGPGKKVKRGANTKRLGVGEQFVVARLGLKGCTAERPSGEWSPASKTRPGLGKKECRSIAPL